VVDLNKENFVLRTWRGVPDFLRYFATEKILDDNA
jgi:hypothetical protein